MKEEKPLTKGELWQQVRQAVATVCPSSYCPESPIVPKWATWISRTAVIFRFRCKHCTGRWERTIENPWSLAIRDIPSQTSLEEMNIT